MDELSWEQLGLMAECIAMHDVERIELLLSPVLGAFGGEYKSGDVSRDAQVWRKSKTNTYADQSEDAKQARALKRDKRIYAAAARWGIGIYDVGKDGEKIGKSNLGVVPGTTD